MSEELNRMWNEYQTLGKEICLKEFEEKGFKSYLPTTFRIYKRTPLYKNKYGVGIPINKFDEHLRNNELIVIAIINPKSCNEHIYYVFDSKQDCHFLSGRTYYTQYINFCLILIEEGIKRKIELRTIDDLKKFSGE